MSKLWSQNQYMPPRCPPLRAPGPPSSSALLFRLRPSTSLLPGALLRPPSPVPPSCSTPPAASPLAPDRPASFVRRSSPPFPPGILSSRASPFPRPPPLKPSRLPRRFLCPRQAGAGTGRQTGGQLEWREAALPGKPGGGLQDWATCGQGQVSLPVFALAVSLPLDIVRRGAFFKTIFALCIGITGYFPQKRTLKFKLCKCSINAYLRRVRLLRELL